MGKIVKSIIEKRHGDDNIFIKLIIESNSEKLEYNVSNFHIINQIYGNQLYQLEFYDKDLKDDLINKIDS